MLPHEFVYFKRLQILLASLSHQPINRLLSFFIIVHHLLQLQRHIAYLLRSRAHSAHLIINLVEDGVRLLSLNMCIFINHRFRALLFTRLVPIEEQLFLAIAFDFCELPWCSLLDFSLSVEVMELLDELCIPFIQFSFLLLLLPVAWNSFLRIVLCFFRWIWF